MGDRTRLWTWVGRLWFVAFVIASASLGVLGVEVWVVLLVVVPLFTATGWLMVPRRSWWGTGPSATLADAEVRKKWRRSEVRFLIIASVAIVLVVPLVLIVTRIAPAS
jgi:hypothetical protein